MSIKYNGTARMSTFIKLEAIQRWTAICHVTYQKFLLCVSSEGQDLYSVLTPKVKHVSLTFSGSHLRAVTDADDDDDHNAVAYTTVLPLHIGRHIANKTQ